MKARVGVWAVCWFGVDSVAYTMTAPGAVACFASRRQALEWARYMNINRPRIVRLTGTMARAKRQP